MHNNMSWFDGALRIMIAALFGAICGIMNWWVGVLAIIPLVTGLSGWCPLYAALGWSTALKDPDAKENTTTSEKSIGGHSHQKAA
jgi:hypothetical protein